MVSTSRPRASNASRVQELTGLPSKSTVHAPQTCTSQDLLLPVSPKRLRMTSSKSSCGSTSISCNVPLRVKEIGMHCLSLRFDANSRINAFPPPPTRTAPGPAEKPSSKARPRCALYTLVTHEDH